MAQLSIYLPPFAPDYSGAGALLFDLKSLTVMHDAGGCTGNYTGHDEPRWYGSNATVFCSALRMIDVIMGNDEKLKKNVIDGIQTLKPEIISLVGSPVPTLIGMDLKGLAVEIENETGIPAVGIETQGTDYYNVGQFKAARALLDKFTVKSNLRDTHLSCNILGATPLDYERGEDIDLLAKELEKAGVHVNMRMGYGYTRKELINAANVDVNVAVSHAGFLIAKYMEQKYGIPYLCGFPVGEDAPAEFTERVLEAADSGKSELFFERKIAEGGSEVFIDKKILIIGDQVIANSIRYSLPQDTKAVVGCLFGIDRELMQEGDLALGSEEEITEAVNDPEYQVIVADPVLEQLLSGNPDAEFIPLPQYAVSGDLHYKEAISIYGKNLFT